MYIPKRYGQSRPDNCPFCGKQAVSKNSQGVPVCAGHKERLIEDIKCVCGEWLDVRQGKFGAYFYCMNCGNVSYSKGLEINPGIMDGTKQPTAAKAPESAKSKSTIDSSGKKHITVTSDEVDFL